MNSVKVLVVDDEVHVRNYLSRIVESLQMTVIAMAESGAEAIELYREHHPNIVLMDVNMPNGTGLEALRKIKELNKNAHIIMVTSVNSMDTVNKCAIFGAKNYILKNNDTESIIERLEEARIEAQNA